MREEGKIPMHRVILLFILFITLSDCCFAQCRSATAIRDSILAIETDTIANIRKLQKANGLLQQFDDASWCKDSVYARLLHRIATLQYLVNDEVASPEAIEYMHQAVTVNTSGLSGAAPDFAVNSYFNLGAFYQSLGVNSKALQYYDSVIRFSKGQKSPVVTTATCRVLKADILFGNGDFQQCAEECVAGLAEADKTKEHYTVTQLLNRRAQAYLYLGQLAFAKADTDSALHHANALNNDFEKATAIIIKALISVKLNRINEAQELFAQAIAIRLRTTEYRQVADDYTDWGNFLIRKMQNYRQAQQCYLNTIKYAQKAGDAERICKGYINLGETAFRLYPQNEYAVTRDYYRKALQAYGLNQNTVTDILPLSGLTVINNADMLLVLLGNKTELLLQLFKVSNKKQYLRACLSTAMVTDSALNLVRREQLGELSKLYWRERTRSFFARALEASYLADDMQKAFYFMEKSRAVLLTDKLNELGAAAHLPLDESKLEQKYKTKIVYAQQQLLQTDQRSPEFQQRRLLLVQAKEQLGTFIKELEQKYPVYYKYRYPDVVPALQELQQSLRTNQQNFVYYFLQDTTGFILAIQPDTTKMIAVQNANRLSNDMNTFLNWCSDKQQLNNHYSSFAALSNQLYIQLFKPLQLNAKRIILCQDHVLLPFEALCSDGRGEDFLVNDYRFSYVYSAGYLMNEAPVRKPSGVFIGFAPGTFREYLKVPDLSRAPVSLKKAATFYNDSRLFTGADATRKHFFQNAPDYSIVNVFSHAVAVSDNTEPVLYMQDSVIRLSELQLLFRPCTQLMMLSACQTNAGKYATGEGIYSLARGFSAAGIPAVAATLWKADEEAIYAVSEKFYEYLSGGMNKDEALQKAKRHFMDDGSRQNLLPYYWANLVLVGNADAIVMQRQPGGYGWLWGVALVTATGLVWLLLSRKKYIRKWGTSN